MSSRALIKPECVPGSAPYYDMYFKDFCKTPQSLASVLDLPEFSAT